MVNHLCDQVSHLQIFISKHIFSSISSRTKRILSSNVKRKSRWAAQKIKGVKLISQKESTVIVEPSQTLLDIKFIFKALQVKPFAQIGNNPRQ